MPFGKTLTNQKEVASKATGAPTFLNLKEGVRIIRVVGNEIQYKVIWLDKKPHIVAVLTDDEFQGYNGESWWDSPLNQYVQNLPEDEKKLAYAKTRFVVNVDDRTPVIIVNEVPIYPDAKGKYASQGVPTPHNTIQVLEQSAGKEGGKHFLQLLVTASENMMNFKTGKRISITEGDLKIATKGTGIETVRSIYPDMNQDPFTPTQVYDLASYVKPWPYAAQRELLEGADYNETRKKYKLQAYPQLVDVNEDDLPF